MQRLTDAHLMGSERESARIILFPRELHCTIWLCSCCCHADIGNIWLLLEQIINARLAMLGFVFGAWREFATGETIMTQLQNRTVSVAFLTILIVYASLVPITKGARFEAFGELTTVNFALCTGEMRRVHGIECNKQKRAILE